MRRLGLLFVSVVFVTVLFGAAKTSAVEYGGVGARPAQPRVDNPRTSSIFIHTISPGTQASDAVKVYNNTDKTRTIRVTAVDAVLASGGAFSCAQESETPQDVGGWIALGTSEVTIAASSNQVVPFTISAPVGAEVGEHNGCIAIQDVTAKSASDKGGVAISFRSALRVVVTIPGKIVKKLEITNVTTSRDHKGAYVVTPTVKNSGNVSLDTAVAVQLTAVYGIAADRSQAVYPVLPRAEATWNFNVKQPFWGGWYRARVTTTYNSSPKAELGSNGDFESTTISRDSKLFFMVPTLVGLVAEIFIFLVLAATASLNVRRRSSRRRVARHWQNYTVKESDTVQSVATQFHVSWRRLVKVNRIKPPYVLKAGRQIKVPVKR